MTHSAIANDLASLIGIWKLISYENEFEDGSPQRAMFGQNPKGYLTLTPEGRMMQIIEAEGRKPAQTDKERSNLLRTMLAYSGTYRVEGDQWITKVDVSWNVAWSGTEQVRWYKLDGDQLQVTSMWQASTNLPGAPVTRGILLWERVK